MNYEFLIFSFLFIQVCTKKSTHYSLRKINRRDKLEAINKTKHVRLRHSKNIFTRIQVHLLGIQYVHT